jgi:hypothetical protein
MARAQRPRAGRIEDLGALEPRPAPALRGAAMPQPTPAAWTPQPPATSPVTAYAPVSDVARAISTGRGLY